MHYSAFQWLLVFFNLVDSQLMLTLPYKSRNLAMNGVKHWIVEGVTQEQWNWELYAAAVGLCCIAIMWCFPTKKDKVISAAVWLIATNIFETVQYPSNTGHWLSFHACKRKDFNCWHAELPTETTTDLVNADSAHNITECSVPFPDNFDRLVHTIQCFMNVG